MRAPSRSCLERHGHARLNNLHVIASQAFVNEKAAPELLDYQADLVSRLQDQIQNQVCCLSHAGEPMRWSRVSQLNDIHIL